MDYQIYAYGHGEILKSVFDALAMCLNAQDGSLYEALKRLGLILGTFWAAVYAIYGDQMKLFTGWIIPSSVIIGLLLVPQTTVWIIDPVTKYNQKVDHVPYGLGAFAGYVSKIGHGITEQVEKVFVLPDDLKYQRSGSLFASNIIQQAKTFHITNQDLADNMRYFVEQCVVYDAMIGRKYTIEDLRHSDDLWRLVSTNASPVRSFVWRNIKGARAGASGDARDEEFKAGSEIITCREGVTKFNQLWNQELNRTASIFGKRIFGNNGAINAKRELVKYLPLSYATLGGIAKSASDIIRQQMMIFSIVDSIDQGATAVGHAPNFAARRAYLQQRSTYETLGAMAGETLPTMKAVLESIAYGAFLVVIPLSLLPFGYRFLLAWGQILLWLQMWAPLYAILNYIMTLAARSKTLSVLSMSNEAGVTLATSVGVANVNADIAAMAGYLAMSIPFLSIALVKGVGSFVHMASHLGNVSQGAASMAAGEATSGNLSFGNMSEGNVQIQQSHMFNQSRASSYKAGSFQMMDGRTDVQTYGDGSQVVNIGTPNLPIGFNKADSLSTQQSQMAAQAQQRGFSLSESSGKNLSSSYRNMADLSESLGQSEQMSDGMTQGVSAEQSKAIHKSAQLIEDFADQNNISTEKAASLFAEVSAGGGLVFKANAGGRTHLNASDTEQLQKATRFAEENSFQDAARESSQAAQNISHTVSDESTKRLAEGVSGSYETGMSERKEAAKSFSESESYTRQAMTTRANSASINANYNQQFMEWLADQPLGNAKARMGMQEAAHIVANDLKLATAYGNRFMETKGLSPNSIPPAPSMRNDYEKDTRHNVYHASHEPMESVRQQANMSDNVSSRGQDFRAGTQQAIDLVGDRVDVGASEVRQKGQKVQDDFKKQEGRWVSGRLAVAVAKEAISEIPLPQKPKQESAQTSYERSPDVIAASKRSQHSTTIEEDYAQPQPSNTITPDNQEYQASQSGAKKETRRGAQPRVENLLQPDTDTTEETDGSIYGEAQQK
ncbi:MAG: conjugal transfer protein TraG N-terminal domain-containing protein [Alphaproteobacteria bacterium]